MTRKIDPQYEEHLLDKMIHSDDPEHLALYIEEGGTLTDGMRANLAKLIRERALKPRGNPNRLRDIDVYLEVERWRKNEVDAPIRKEIKEAGLTGMKAMHHFLSAPRNALPSCQKAYVHLTIDDPEAKTEAIQKQYERGREILSPES